jgi:hypothetical protein
MMCSVFENVENHAYSKKPFGIKVRFQERPGTISRSDAHIPEMYLLNILSDHNYEVANVK